MVMPLLAVKKDIIPHYCPNVCFQESRKSIIENQLRVKMLFIDLNSESPLHHTSVAKRKERAYEFQENDLLSTDGLFAYVRI